MMDGGVRKEKTGKRKLTDANKKQDHTAKESPCIADNSQISHITDSEGQKSCGPGGSTQAPAKPRRRQAKTSKKGRPKVTTDECEMK